MTAEQKELNDLHKLLRKAKYFYYEKHDNIMSDYDYDMKERKYDELADRLGIKKKDRVTEQVGFSHDIRMALYYEEGVIDYD